MQIFSEKISCLLNFNHQLLLKHRWYLPQGFSRSRAQTWRAVDLCNNRGEGKFRREREGDRVKEGRRGQEPIFKLVFCRKKMAEPQATANLKVHPSGGSYMTSFYKVKNHSLFLEFSSILEIFPRNRLSNDRRALLMLIRRRRKSQNSRTTPAATGSWCNRPRQVVWNHRWRRLVAKRWRAMTPALDCSQKSLSISSPPRPMA